MAVGSLGSAASRDRERRKSGNALTSSASARATTNGSTHSTNANKAQYDAAVRSMLAAERVKLWDSCEREYLAPGADVAMDLAYLKTV